MSRNIKKNEIRNALERELKNVQLSDRMKKDILYNAQHSKKPVQKRHAYRYVCAAAAVVVLMCASLLLRGGQVFPDTRYEPTKPLAQNNTPVAAAENTPAPQEPVPETTSPPLPVLAAGEMVWTTESGRFYHLVENCSGMENSLQISRSEAMVLEKQPCPMCIAFVTPIPEEAAVTPEPTATPVIINPDSENIPDGTELFTYYGTEHGKFYHSDDTCSGMQNADWLIDLSGKQPCPVCLPGVTPAPINAQALSTPEPVEMPVSEAVSTPEPVQTYYGFEHSLFFHRDEHCSGMENAVIITDLTGMLPCTKCVSYFSDYYGTEHGTYYHLDEHCSGMQDAFILGDLSEKQPCPVCVLSADTAPMEENISVSD